MKTWQHKSTRGATATPSQIKRLDAIEHALGRRKATLHLGPCDTPGAFAIGITFDSQAIASQVGSREKCGMLFHDGYIVWGTRDEMMRETPLVDRWAEIIGVHVRPEYETAVWSREAAMV